MVKHFIILFVGILLPFISQGQTKEWIEQSVSGSVTVFYPAQPGKRDTIGQTMYFLNDGKDLMLTTVAPIPENVVSLPGYSPDSVLNNFIQSIIQGATLLINSDVEYKGISSRFYKVRIDDDLNPIQGLIADSYNFIHHDTIYSFSYLRYDATELYDYNKQRMFFDMVEVSGASASQKTSSDINESPELSVEETPVSGLTTSKIITLILCFLVIIAGLYWLRIRTKK